MNKVLRVVLLICASPFIFIFLGGVIPAYISAILDERGETLPLGLIIAGVLGGEALWIGILIFLLNMFVYEF